MTVATDRPSDQLQKGKDDQAEVIRSEQNVVPYDENLLERSRTQWQFGDWKSLTRLGRDSLQHHPDRAKLALLAAAGRMQTGQSAEARQFVLLALEWGISKKLVSQILIAGVHNSIGRAAAVSKQENRALQHFKNAINTGAPGCDTELLTRARTLYQISQLGLATLGDCAIVSGVGAELAADNQSFSIGLQPTVSNEKYGFFRSGQYWDDRYKKGGTSGNGSYGKLAEFKSNIINRFISAEAIDCVVEFGCGDGNQLSKLSAGNYVGVDVSQTVVDKCKRDFEGDPSKSFYTLDEYLASPVVCELTLSLDVIYHLTEDEVFHEYMNILFESSKKFVIIYSANSTNLPTNANHVKGRVFTRWIEEFAPAWELFSFRKNDYPFSQLRSQKESSFSDFYFYRKICR